MREADLQRVRFLTSSYEEQQGLRTAAWMLWFLGFIWIQQFVPRTGWMRVASYALVSLNIPLIREPLRRFYARRTGRVTGRDFPPIEFRWVLWFLAAIPVLYAGQSKVALACAWLAYPTYLAWSGWPYRAHYVLLIVLALAVTWNPGSPVGDADIQRRFLALAVGIALIGLCDHVVLIRTLTAARRQGAGAIHDEA